MSQNFMCNLGGNWAFWSHDNDWKQKRSREEEMKRRGNVKRAVIGSGRWQIKDSFESDDESMRKREKNGCGVLTVECRRERWRGKKVTKVILTAWHTLLLHYTAVRRAPGPLRRFSPSEERHSTPGLAFLHAVTNMVAHKYKGENNQKNSILR